jgi:hypothetical protein
MIQFKINYSPNLSLEKDVCQAAATHTPLKLAIRFQKNNHVVQKQQSVAYCYSIWYHCPRKSDRRKIQWRPQ